MEQIRKTEVEERKSNATESGDTTTQDLEAIATEDEDEEEAYEAWKLRELKRIKRDRDLKEKMERERDDIERIHEMTEEERKLFFRQNPLTVTNKMPKGKYKFMQKYYHRGAFYLVSINCLFETVGDTHTPSVILQFFFQLSKIVMLLNDTAT